MICKKSKCSIQVFTTWQYNIAATTYKVCCVQNSSKDKQLLSLTIYYKRAKDIFQLAKDSVRSQKSQAAVICNSISGKKPRTSCGNTFYYSGLCPYIYDWLRLDGEKPWFRLWLSLVGAQT